MTSSATTGSRSWGSRSHAGLMAPYMKCTQSNHKHNKANGACAQCLQLRCSVHMYMRMCSSTRARKPSYFIHWFIALPSTRNTLTGHLLD